MLGPMSFMRESHVPMSLLGVGMSGHKSLLGAGIPDGG